MMDKDRLERLAPYVWAEVGSMAQDRAELVWLTERVAAGDYVIRHFPESQILEVEIGASDPERGPWVLYTSPDPDEHFASAIEGLAE